MEFCARTLEILPPPAQALSQSEGGIARYIERCLLLTELEIHIVVYKVIQKVAIDLIVIHVHNEGSTHKLLW